MIVLNILAFIVLFLTIFVTYLKIQYPFWNAQPVLHTYDFFRKLKRKPFIVLPNNPVKNKFCNFENIDTKYYSECSPEDKLNLENILQCYYMPNESIMYTINKENMDAYLVGGTEPSMISFYCETKYDCSGGVIGVGDDIIAPDFVCSTIPIGFISSRYVHFYFLDGELYSEYPLYFIDFISIHRERDFAKTCRQLIQTHEYNQRIRNPNISCSLIKKEIELFAGVVPLVKYNTTTYNLRNNQFPPLPDKINIIRVKKENIDILHDFLHTQTKTDARLFDICIFTDVASIIELIEENLLYIYCLKRDEDIYGYYFVKDIKTAYENLSIEGGSDVFTLHCISSFLNTRDERLFYLGFLHCIHEIVKYNKDYKMLLFDEIGHNVVLYKHWRKKYTPILTTPTAYYLFNLIYPQSPIKPEKIFILT